MQGGGTGNEDGATPRAMRRMWRGMLRRCYEEKSHNFKDYGGRGIRVCDQWHAFEQFLADMGVRPTPQHRIDRRDNDQGYSPENCRWVLHKENCRNRRSSRYVTAFGRTQTMAAWAEEYELHHSLITYRIDRAGMSPEQALTTPAVTGRHFVTAFGRAQSLAAWARETGLSYPAIKYRIDHQGMTPELALTLPKSPGRRRNPDSVTWTEGETGG